MAIYIRNGIENHEIAADTESLESVGFQIENLKLYYVCNRLNIPINVDDLLSLTQSIYAVLAGDFNDAHEAWNCETSIRVSQTIPELRSPTGDISPKEKR